MEKKLKKALDIVSLARKELPASFVIAKSLPDAFSEGCNRLWGSKIETIILGGEFETSGDKSADSEQPEPKRQKIVEDSDDCAAETIAQVEEQKIDIDPMETSDPTGWGDVADVEYDAAGGWGTTAWGDAPADGQSGWGESIGDTWDGGATWDIGDIPSLMESLGPTSLPLTHTTGIVETSTRRIISIVPPIPSRKKLPKSGAKAVEAELEEKFSKVVLAPWLSWDKHELSDISRPVILPKSRGEVAGVAQNGVTDRASEGSSKPHDPFNDEIAVFIDPSLSEKLLIGMGLGATWVQIARMDKDENPVSGAPSMWYLEHLTQIIPSYHMDP
jgi:hypothetical protein